MNNSQNESYVSLLKLGWTDFFQNQYEKLDQTGLTRARVVNEERSLYRVIDETGLELLSDLPGKWRFEAQDRIDYPATGDWVLVEPRYGEGRATVRHLFERKTCLVRRAVGSRENSQVIASNVDVALIVSSMNADLNLRRLERYVTLVRESGAEPVLVLSKSDLADDDPTGKETATRALEPVARNAKVLVLSSQSGEGLDELRGLLRPGSTFVLIGSSGVGKSTLVNRLHGSEIMETFEIREDDSKGRHTTTSRHLIQLPSGALLMDTPGMRELALWDASEGLEEAFDDVGAIARECRFTDCRHEGEPGCAVARAIEAGELTAERVKNHRQLERELAFQERKRNKEAMSREREKWKKISKAQRAKRKLEDS